MHRYKQYPAGQPTSTSTATTTAPSGNVNSHSIYGSHPAQVPRSFSSPYYLRNSYQMSPSLPKSRSATSVQSMVSSNNTALPPKNPPDRYHRRRSVTSTVLESSLDNNNNKQQTPSPAASVGKLPKPEVPTTEAPRQKLMKVHSDTSATINKHQKPDTSTAHISKVAAKQATSQQQQHKPRQSTNGSIKPPQKRASVQQGKGASQQSNGGGNVRRSQYNKVRSRSATNTSISSSGGGSGSATKATPPPLVLPSDVRRHSLASYSSTSLNSCLRMNENNSSSSSPKTASSFIPPPPPPPAHIAPPVVPPPAAPALKERKMSNTSTASSPAAFSSVKRPAQSPLSSSSPSFVTNSSNTSLDTLESNSSKKSFSARLKKAFSFGRGSSKPASVTSPSPRQGSSFVPTGAGVGGHRARKPSIGAQSTKSAFVRSTDASDTHSVMSTKSTQSAVSLTSLKRMSRSFFSTKKHKQQSSVDQQDEDSGVQSPTLLMPHLKAPNQHQPSPLSAVSANPVLSHSVAEAEIPPTPPPQQQQQQQQQQQLTVPPKYGGFAGFAPPTPPPSSSDDCTTIRKSEESESRPIPSLSSSATCSSDYEPGHHKLSSLDQDVEVEHEVQEEEDDVTSVGDTVFPKKLDVVTVETIRSSLERTKSLERRRSRRSTKSAKSEKSEGTTTEIAAKSAQEEEEEDSDDKETIPNPTEVHVHDEDISVDLNKDMPAPKSILKSSTSSEQLSSPSPNNNIANDDNDQNNKQSNNNTTATTIADSTTTTTTTTTLDMINFDVLDSDLNLDFNFEKLPDSLPEEIDQEDMDGAKKELSKIEYQYQPMQYDNKSHKRPHSRSSSHRTSSSSERHTLQPPTNNRTNQFYHPLYQKRISQFVPSHNNNNTSTASASSSSASSIFSRPPPEKKTHANNATVSFSSRIVIYDTYDRSDYDRRAELATCNRLTPILAQQIKEELNNFKMEMDIHADSRIYTHFF